MKITIYNNCLITSSPELYSSSDNYSCSFRKIIHFVIGYQKQRVVKRKQSLLDGNGSDLRCWYKQPYQIWKLYFKGYRNYEYFFKTNRFQNLSADSEAKATGVKTLTSKERSCPKACVCQICNLIGIGVENDFWNLNADFNQNPNKNSEVKVKITSDKRGA